MNSKSNSILKSKENDLSTTLSNEENKSFYSVVGEKSGSLNSGLLVPNKGMIIVDGQWGVQNKIPGVVEIWISDDDPNYLIYRYQIHVKASVSHRINMWFYDQDNDMYFLVILSPISSTHVVNYNSKKPAINQIVWSSQTL